MLSNVALCAKRSCAWVPQTVPCPYIVVTEEHLSRTLYAISCKLFLVYLYLLFNHISWIDHCCLLLSIHSDWFHFDLQTETHPGSL